MKLGGVNSVVESDTTSEFLKNPSHATIFIGTPACPVNLLSAQCCELGADVIHPAPNTEKPSYAAVVGSVDCGAAKYVAASSVQKGRQEIIADMKDMCKACSTRRSKLETLTYSAS